MSREKYVIELEHDPTRAGWTSTATLVYGQSLSGRNLQYRTYGSSIDEALMRMAKAVKREGIPHS